jgi:hypothetical protein
MKTAKKPTPKKTARKKPTPKKPTPKKPASADTFVRHLMESGIAYKLIWKISDDTEKAFDYLEDVASQVGGAEYAGLPCNWDELSRLRLVEAIARISYDVDAVEAAEKFIRYSRCAAMFTPQ